MGCFGFRRWRDYQHYPEGSRSIAWVKFYVALLDDSEAEKLSHARFGVLSRLLLLAARTSNCMLDDTAWLSRKIGRVTRKDLDALAHWLTPVEVCASKPASTPASASASTLATPLASTIASPRALAREEKTRLEKTREDAESGACVRARSTHHANPLPRPRTIEDAPEPRRAHIARWLTRARDQKATCRGRGVMGQLEAAHVDHEYLPGLLELAEQHGALLDAGIERMLSGAKGWDGRKDWLKWLGRECEFAARDALGGNGRHQNQNAPGAVILGSIAPKGRGDIERELGCKFEDMPQTFFDPDVEAAFGDK